jgi:hypothetical protein
MILMIAMLGVGLADGEPPRVAERWMEMDKAILSAHLRFVGYRIWHSAQVMPMTQGDVLELCRKLEGMTHQERTAAFEQWIVPEARADRALKCEQWREGKRLRENGKYYDVIHDGERDIIRDSGNRQVEIFHLGGASMGLWRLRDFRILPKINDADYMIVEKSAAETTIERIVKSKNFNNLGSRIIFANTTLIPRLILIKNNDKVSDVIYQGMVVPGGSQLPSFVFEAELKSDGRVRSLTGVFLESAELNEPVSDDVFRASVPQGWTILDKRSTPGRVLQVSQAVDDAVAAMNESQNLPPPVQPEPVVRVWRWWHYALVAGAALAIVVLGVRMVRARRIVSFGNP